jgi:hypothetical protein
VARVATLLLLAARVSAADDWTFKKSEGGLALEERSVPGSPFREYRVIAELDVDPAWAAEVVWTAQRSGDVEDLKQRRVLRDEPDRLVFYDQIRTAMVSDRDYVLEVTRRRDAGRTEIRLQSIDDPLAPPAKGFVRMGSDPAPAQPARQLFAIALRPTRISFRAHLLPDPPQWVESDGRAAHVDGAAN